MVRVAVPIEEAPNHHGSHQCLLWSPDDSPPSPQGINAIIVPTARRPAYLTRAARLARELDCTLVTLHSGKWTSAAETAQWIPANVDLIAIDVAEQARLRLPDWETSRKLAGTVFARRTDTSTKRNLALMLGHMLGWSRVLFLDDDMTGVKAADVREVSGLLNVYNTVGLKNVGYPDNSVVCHAFRDAGGEQQSFIGGGALAVQIERNKSFFPDIYNEDWFFLLNGNKRLQPTAMAGEVTQDRYDPFRNDERARAEELGDVLAEGIYWLLDQKKSIGDANKRHWSAFLKKRHQFINQVLRMVAESPLEPGDKRRRIDALKGSLGRLALITPELCEGYLQAWTADQQRWYGHLEQLPAGQTRASALACMSREGSPRLRWKLGGQGIDRELTPIRVPARPNDWVLLGRLTAQTATPLQIDATIKASATAGP